MKRLTAAIILGLASLFFAVNPAVAQNDATVTARDVVDRKSLKAFVLEARARRTTHPEGAQGRPRRQAYRGSDLHRQAGQAPLVAL